jgi:hypothetical protein
MTPYRLGWIFAICVLSQIVGSSACASLGALGQIVQPPRFEEARDREAELRFLAPSTNMPIGGAGVRMWLEVTNPNAFGFSVTTLTATLLLEGNRAATGDFPLGLPLQAGQKTVVPLDLAVNFSDLPGLAGTLRRIAVGGVIPYVLEGTVGVDAGRLGKPSFGPMQLTTGELRVAR